MFIPILFSANLISVFVLVHWKLNVVNDALASCLNIWVYVHEISKEQEIVFGKSFCVLIPFPTRWPIRVKSTSSN